jgi:hypothetical protein
VCEDIGHATKKMAVLHTAGAAGAPVERDRPKDRPEEIAPKPMTTYVFDTEFISFCAPIFVFT